jgi:hypothetical protein
MAGVDVVTSGDLTNMFTQDPGVDFADQSQLTYIIPSQTNLDLETLFNDGDSGDSILESIDTREFLFFGPS